MTRLHRLVLKILGTVVLFSSVALAQTATGSISGLVQDESGAVIAGAGVTVTNVDQGISNALVTDASGRYHVPSLIPGHYEIQAQVTGFETGVRRGVQLTVGSSLEINMTLKVGQVTQQTVVTAEAPIVETATSTVSGLVDEKTIRDLPLNGRSFDQLIALQSSAPSFRSRQVFNVIGFADAYSVSGARTLSNMYLMDGTQMVSGGAVSTPPGGVLGKNMGVDAIQEFTVLSSNYSAAYGKKNGGVINIATRSGTNQFHGAAFEFLRNAALDARNFFDKAADPPPFKRNNFGGAIGGPIRKDSSFFFGNYEGLRESLGLTNLAVVPDATAHQGLLPGPGGQLLNVGVAPAVRPFLETLYPLPNGRSFGDGTGEFLSNPNKPSVQDFFLVRFDQRMSDKDSFFARYNFTRANQLTPDQTGSFASISRSRDQILTLEEKRAYARTVNLLRFGFSRGNLYSDSFATVPLDSGLRFYPWADIVGSIRFSASGSVAGAISPAGGGNVNRSFIVNQFDVADQLFHYRGPHSLQFGVQAQRIQHNSRYTPGDARGTFQFADLAGLLAGRATQFTGLAEGGFDPTKAYRVLYFTSYLQDDYKLLRNLTLNLGVRYELYTVPVEASGNRISNYHYRWVDGLRVLDSTPTLGSPFFQGNHNAFAPRIGLAWDPFRDGKLAVRGGFGIFYDQVEDFRYYTPPNPPYVRLQAVSNPPFPLGFSGAAGTSPLPNPDVIDFNLRIPTRLQYSLGVQRQVTSSSVFSLSYVGSHSYHLTRQMDFNTARPQILPGGEFFVPAGAPRLNPALADTRSVQTDANGFYNSLQLDFTQRPTRGIRYKLSYTFAKSMDESSRTQNGVAAGEPSNPQNPLDRKGQRGLSVYDIRNNFVTNFTYDVPGRNLAGLSGRVLGGWQLGGIVTLSSGSPFTALTGFNRSRSLDRANPDRPNLKAGASNNPVLGGPDRYYDPTAFELPLAGFFGNLGRNTLIGPGFANVDFTLAKATAVTERLKADFRAEFFNLFNRANFGLPSITNFNSSGQRLGAAGRIQSTVATSRQVQFGLKLSF